MSSLLDKRFGGAAARACAASIAFALTASAQLTAPLGERRLVPNSGVPRWLGDVSACGGPLCTQTASAEASLPLMGSLQMVIGGSAARVLTARSPWTGERRVDLRYSTGALSIWAGGVRTDGLVSDTTSPLRTRLESGFRFATTNAEIALSLSGGRRSRQWENSIAVPSQLYNVDSGTMRVDSIPGSTTQSQTEIVSLTELRGSWSVGRFLLSTVAGRGAALGSSPMFWGSLEAATPLSRGPLAFLNVGFSNASTTARFIALPRRSMSVGLRFSSATFASRAASRRVSDASSSTFIVQRETAGRYRLRVKIAGARLVELASDCTRWQPVTLAHERDNEWEIVLPVSAGSHLVNIRVDGGQWIAPPGLVAKMDDFAGVVGVFVVD
jgi:hypothetical protein